MKREAKKRPTVTLSRKALKGMEKKVEDLRMLMEVSALISSTLDFNQLITLVMDRAKQVMDAEACSIMLYNRETGKLEFEVALCRDDSTCEVLKKQVMLDVGQGIAGWVAQHLKPLVIEDVKKDGRFYEAADRRTGFRTKSLIAVPLIGRSGLIGVAEILNPKRKKHFEEYDSEIFQALCRQVAVAIENSLFYKESLERERMKQELDIASALQKSFLPESPVLKKGNLTVSAVNMSAAKVGGDIYDFIGPIDRKVGVLIGDVSGKGVSAALYMAKFISDFRYVAHHMEPPGTVLDRLNSLLFSAPRGMFVTVLYLVVDLKAGTLQLSSAGHPPFLRLTKGGMRVMTVPSGPPLGIMPVDEFPLTTIPLDRGERLILLTDGVFDAKNRRGQRLGFENLVRFVNGHIEDEQLLTSIVEYVDDFSRGAERADDITLVEMRWGA